MVKPIKCTVVRSAPLASSYRRAHSEPEDAAGQLAVVEAAPAGNTVAWEPAELCPRILIDNQPGNVSEPYKYGEGIPPALFLDVLV